MIIAIASQKGGIGKSSSSIALSSGLARKGKKTLLIDVDPQANSSKILADDYKDLSENQTIYTTIIDNNPLTIHKTSLPNLDIVPSHILLSKADSSLQGLDRHHRLKDHLASVAKQYDYIFVDNPPNLGVLTLNSLTAADKIIVPVSPGFFELDSISQLSDTIRAVQNRLNPNLQVLGYLFTMSSPTVESRDSLKMLRSALGDQVFKTVIPRNVSVAEAHHKRQDIFTYDENSRAAEEYNRLINEVFNL